MKLTLHVWRQKDRNDAGRMETYPADDVSPDMSFLEMLDVVNEELIKQGRGADRVRPRLPRGHLRLVRDDDQRHGRTARSAATTDLPAPHAAASRTASTSTSSRGGRKAFPVVKDLVSTARRSTASSRRAGSCR